MSTASLLRWLRSGFQNGRTRRHPRAGGSAVAARRRSWPIRVEALEGRIALSTIVVNEVADKLFQAPIATVAVLQNRSAKISLLDAINIANNSNGPDTIGRRGVSVTFERLATRTLKAVAAEVEQTVMNVTRTHDMSRASARLGQITSEIPSGLQQLAPVWQHDLASYRSQTPGSRQAFKQQLLADLKHEVAAGVAAGEFRLIGAGAADYLRSADSAQSSLDSVTIRNRTGFNITVTAFLQNTQRWMTRTITNQGSQFFDFGSTTNNFISINVARADGRTPPPPFNGVSLDRPFQGYSGTSFSISTFGGYFTKSIG